MKNLEKFSLSTTIRVSKEEAANHTKVKIPYPENLNWDNCRVIPTIMGESASDPAPTLKIQSNGETFSLWNTNVQWSILFIFIKIY